MASVNNSKCKNTFQKGIVNIFVHGILADRQTFANVVKHIRANTNEKICDLGVITYRKHSKKEYGNKFTNKIHNEYEIIKELALVLSKKDYQKLKNPRFQLTEDFKKLTAGVESISIKCKIDYLISQGYNILVRFEGSHINPSHEETFEELSNAINHLANDDVVVNLIGHSRGGLLSLEFALSNHGRVNKVITVGTPYIKNKIADKIAQSYLVKDMLHVEGEGALDLAGHTPYLDYLFTEWNTWGHAKIDLHTIGVNWKNRGDFVVDIYSQLAICKEKGEFKNTKRYLLEYDKPYCVHTNECETEDIIELILSLLNGKNIDKYLINHEDLLKSGE